eukprot:1442406-Rhodomonas_salina.2
MSTVERIFSRLDTGTAPCDGAAERGPGLGAGAARVARDDHSDCDVVRGFRARSGERRRKEEMLNRGHIWCSTDAGGWSGGDGCRRTDGSHLDGECAQVALMSIIIIMTQDVRAAVVLKYPHIDDG